MFNLIQVHPEEDDEERKEVNQRDFEDDDEDNSLMKKLKKEKSSNVNYAVLKKQIRIYNLIQNGRMKMIDEINLKEEYLAEDINILLETISKYPNITFIGNGAELHKDLILDNLFR